jgi:chlorobactene glucosyltransferase
MELLVLSSVFLVSGVIIITWMHNQYHLDIVVRPAHVPEDGPLISICVPARNEERNVLRCVGAILAQTYPRIEVIVLDDRSTDSTPQIVSDLAASEPRLRMISGSQLSSGWAGKPHALVQAVAHAQGDWLCFIDADTFVTPHALAAVYASTVETKADMFTIMTGQIMMTFWERAVLPLVMLGLSIGFSPRKVNDPDRKDAIANGQFILIKRDVYTAIGGHEAIKDSIVEDKDLAVMVKNSGYRLVVADGRQVASTRMYTSFPELWEGWTKNIYLGLRDEPGLLLLGVFGAFLAITAALLLPGWVILGISLAGASGDMKGFLVLVEAVLLWGYLIYWRARGSREMGIPTWYALTTPIGAGVFAAMMVTSTWNVLSGKGVTWKGRTYTR